MTAHALISGTLFRTPERKTSRNDRPFVQATVKTKDGDVSTFWRIFAFSQSVQEELLKLRDGDALAMSGTMRAEVWTPEGKDPRVSLTLTADAILPLRREKQPRDKQDADTPSRPAAPADRSTSARRASAHRSPYAPHGAHATDAALDDDIPF
jgi:single-stranded DNA-binding protein